jgi:hemerythrin
MAELKWSDAYLTGVSQIDDQHQLILRLLVDLADQVRDERDTLGETVEAMASYVDEHFGLEEQLLERCDYPELAAHRALHRTFVRRVLGLQKALRSDDVTGEMVDETVGFLSSWFVEHVTGEDLRYVAHLEAAGLRH